MYDKIKFNKISTSALCCELVEQLMSPGKSIQQQGFILHAIRHLLDDVLDIRICWQQKRVKKDICFDFQKYSYAYGFRA